MGLFRAFLVVVFTVIVCYTAIVIDNHGTNLFAVFFGDMAKLGWAGQFNLDFMFMLAFSAVWVAWRHAFSASGLLLAIVAFLSGSPFLCVYLLVVTTQANGDMHEVLLGKTRATS